MKIETSPKVLGVFKKWYPGRVEELERIEKKASVVVLEISAKKDRHTKEQQGGYWAALHEFGRFLGYSAHEAEEMLHPAVCTAAFGQRGTRFLRSGGVTYSWPVPRATSSKDEDGNPRDVETYSMLIDSLLRLASEYGCYLEIKAHGGE